MKNLALVAGSIIFAVLLSLSADRIFGAIRRPPGLPETMELIFPPFSEQHYETADFRYSVYINAIGIRDRELPRERGDAYRVLAIGDSYTYGWGVDIENTWTRQLETRLRAEGRDIEILNLGKPGVGPPFYSELAEKAIPLLRPDLVLVCLLQGNDIRAAGEETATLKTRSFWDLVRRLYPSFTLYMRDLRREREYSGRSQEEMPKQVSNAEDNRRWTANTAQSFLEKMTQEQRTRFDAFDEEVKTAYTSGNLNPYMIDLAMQNPDFYILTMDVEDAWTQTCIERTAGHLRRIKQVAEEYGSDTVVICIPEGPYVNRPALMNMGRVGYNMPDWLLTTNAMDESPHRAATLAGLRFFEFTDAFRKRQDDPALYFELDGHPTPAGNRLLAESMRSLWASITSQP
ncbi:MAG TPA: SGNH/GDSL hydrolase family protein [Candidatus Hydrogenedentes bacterium]|nr:SGNH/GDSL hydrolase family protein [Candidatus Hydrogenedentota bacterium]